MASKIKALDTLIYLLKIGVKKDNPILKKLMEEAEITPEYLEQFIHKKPLQE